MNTRHTALAATLAAAAALSAAPLQAAGRGEIITLTWSDSGLFERALTVGAGRFVEVCGPVASGQQVHWRFEADAPLNFNVHYHEGPKVHYPARQDGASQAAGTLQALSAQDYCWMWSRAGDGPAQLTLRLQRQPN